MQQVWVTWKRYLVMTQYIFPFWNTSLKNAMIPSKINNKLGFRWRKLSSCLSTCLALIDLRTKHWWEENVHEYAFGMMNAGENKHATTLKRTIYELKMFLRSDSSSRWRRIIAPLPTITGLMVIILLWIWYDLFFLCIGINMVKIFVCQNILTPRIRDSSYSCVAEKPG